MKIAAVIAEYDPFHNGHKYLLDRAVSDGAEAVVIIMSGAFTQRGEAAMFSKFDRAAMALRCGADLVVELPVTYAVAGAKRFAEGGVKIARMLRVTDLYFGSECGDIKLLSDTADIYASEKIKQSLKDELSKGVTFAAARKISAERLLGKELPTGANDNLATEYIGAIKSFGADIVPHAVTRHNVLHNSDKADGKFASASFLRKLIGTGNTSAERFIPANAYNIVTEAVKDGRIAEHARLEKAILYRLRAMNKDDFANLPDISEGLENRLVDAAANAGTLEEFYSLVKSKRYTMARIKRITASALIGITADDCSLPPHIRILGADNIGRTVINGVNEDAPIISRPSKFSGDRLFSIEARATDIAALAFKTVGPSHLDLTTGVITVK